jgi:tetratricopeptide (TPR) repeat protein
MRQKELQADDWGFLYAALAGYPVQTLLNKQVDGSGSFFSLWMKQTNTRVDRAHPAPEDRARLLQTRLQTLLKTVRYFEFGVRLAYFGRYEEAIPLFEAVQREFPSREVLGALGYSYLRLAEQEMISTEAYRFWLPRELDINTRLKSLEFHPVRGADGEPDPVVEDYLRRAEDFLQRAVVADPGYVPAWRNLFTVQFHLRDFLMAQGTIGKLLKLEDVNSEYIGLQALSTYFSQLDNTPEIALQALQPLRKEAVKPTAPASVLYNLAMLNALPDKSQTKALWERLNAVAKTVPGPYQARICQQVTPDQCKFENGAQETCAYSLKIKSPLQPGLDLWALPDGGAKLLRQWKSIPFQWSELNRNGRFFYLPDEDIEALEINNMIELVVIRGKRLNNATINIAVCPASETDVSGGTIIRLDAQQALLTREDKSQELWLLRKRGR